MPTSVDWSKYSYVIASEYRVKVLKVLTAGPKTPKHISKETRIYLSHVSKTLRELSEKGIVECLSPERKRGKVYNLTKDGKEIIRQLEKVVGGNGSLFGA